MFNFLVRECVMKRFLCVVASAILFTGLTVGAAAPAQAQAQASAGSKLAYVNSQTILQQTPGYAKAESTFTKEVDTYRQEVQKLQATLDSAAADFEQQSVMLSPTARTTKRKDLQGQQDKLQQRTDELRDKAAARERELLDPIRSRISTVIDGIRAEGNYAMIFDVSSSNGVIVSADKSLDITAKVIQRLQAGK
jgi:outer membrane protein